LSEWSTILPVLTLLAGIPSGAWLWNRWLGRCKVSSKLALPLPGSWPLRGRPIFSSHEQEVWGLLNTIFHDHAVMVKIPILRFTQLRELPTLKSARNAAVLKSERLKSDQWLEMLAGLYTTFTICTLEGKVVACVDVPGRQESGKSSRELKEALLLDCGIAYAEATAHNLLDAGVLRELFLGEMPAAPVDQQPTRGGDSDFHAEMAAFTKQAKLAD